MLAVHAVTSRASHPGRGMVSGGLLQRPTASQGGLIGIDGVAQSTARNRLSCCRCQPLDPCQCSSKVQSSALVIVPGFSHTAQHAIDSAAAISGSRFDPRHCSASCNRQRQCSCLASGCFANLPETMVSWHTCIAIRRPIQASAWQAFHYAMPKAVIDCTTSSGLNMHQTP